MRKYSHQCSYVILKVIIVSFSSNVVVVVILKVEIFELIIAKGLD